MALKKAGFFRELEHGDPDGPSLQEARWKLPAEISAQVSEYLNKGTVLAAAGDVAKDWFEPEADAAPMNVLTDGEWVWSADLAYYVEKYRVGVPDDFIIWMQSKKWRCPILRDDELLETEKKFFG